MPDLKPKMSRPVDNGLSNSEKSTFLTCRRKWYWQFEKKYEVLGTPTPFLVGGAMHKILAEFYSTGENVDVDAIVGEVFKPVLSGEDGRFLSPEQLEDIEKQRVMTLGMGRAYLQMYHGDLEKWTVLKAVVDGQEQPLIETAARFRINQNWWMYFTADLVVQYEGKPWVVEHKTTSVIDPGYVARLSLDDQVSTYMLGVERAYGIKPVGVIYNVMMKPRIRQKQKETRDEYLARVLALYQESPTEYLYRAPVLRSEQDMEVFTHELNLFTGELEHAKAVNFYPKNTMACTGFRGTCQYMPLCIEGEEAASDRFRIRPNRSQYAEDED